MRVDEFDAANLAAAVLGKPEPEEDEQLQAVEHAFLEEHGLDLESFAQLLEKLLPLCAEGHSPLTGRHYRGFAKGDCFIVKVEVKGDPDHG